MISRKFTKIAFMLSLLYHQASASDFSHEITAACEGIKSQSERVRKSAIVTFRELFQKNQGIDEAIVVTCEGWYTFAPPSSIMYHPLCVQFCTAVYSKRK